jgi:hypothetical protein
MISLGGIELNENMVWTERFAFQNIAQTLKRTLGGNPVVFSSKLQLGTPITLEATVDYGWLEKSVVDQLLVLASTPGSVYPLVFGADTFNVGFRHHEPPAIQMNPFTPRVTHSDSDLFFGYIRLITL